MKEERTNNRIKHVKVWTDKRTGIEYARFRRKGLPEQQLPTPVGSDAFWTAYQRALAGEVIPRNGATTIGAAVRSPAGSFSAAVAAYLVSPDWNGLARKTRQQRRALLERIRSEFGANPIRGPRGIDAKAVRLLLDAESTGHARKHMRNALRHFMRWALAHELIDEDPSLMVKAPAPKSDGYPTWSEEQIAQFEAHHPIGTMPRLMFALALCTGQRRGDLIRIGRQHFRAGALRIKQTKTGALVEVPVLPELLAAMAAMTGTDNLRPVLATTKGEAMTGDYATAYFARACRAAGIPPRLSLHGLRKGCCRRLAEAGCTVHEIASISGHTTLKEVERYCREFSRTTAARAATAKLERARAEMALANQVANT